MSSQFPPIPPIKPTPVVAIPSEPGLWDRISTWASENKAAVYTIAGVSVLVTGAGIYYINSGPVCCEATRATGASVCPSFLYNFAHSRHLLIICESHRAPRATRDQAKRSEGSARRRRRRLLPKKMHSPPKPVHRHRKPHLSLQAMRTFWI